MTSSLPKPVMRAALRFHSFTSPLASMPKMGALAVSMSIRKSFATRDSSVWLCVISVMSWPTPTTPTMPPDASQRVVAFSSTSTRSPCLVKSGKVKLSVFCPLSALRSTSLTEARFSSRMYRSTRCSPITSSLLKPVICAALRFHSLTRPLASMPKIGAFAVSMTCFRSLATWLSSDCVCVILVMSWPTPKTPTIWPVLSSRGVALSSTSTRCPRLVNSGKMKWSVLSPLRSASSSTFLTSARNSSVMYCCTRSCPITSSLVYSVIAAALRFHSFTSPLASMPKIGAFAVSMSSVRSLATRDSSVCWRVVSCPTPTTPRQRPSAPLRLPSVSSSVCAVPPGPGLSTISTVQFSVHCMVSRNLSSACILARRSGLLSSSSAKVSPSDLILAVSRIAMKRGERCTMVPARSIIMMGSPSSSTLIIWVVGFAAAARPVPSDLLAPKISLYAVARSDSMVWSELASPAQPGSSDASPDSLASCRLGDRHLILRDG